MKTLKLVVGIALFSIVVWSCKNEAEPKIETVEVTETKAVKEIDADATIAKAEFKIEGMTCAIGCAKTIEKKLSKMEGVKSATVDFDKKMAMVEYDEAKVTTTSLEETVTKTSEQYTVSDMKTVESFTTDGAKKACDKDCKKACCAGKDVKECNHKGEACKEGIKGCKMGEKASMEANKGEKMAVNKKECKGKTACKGKSKKECKIMKGDKADMGTNEGEKIAAACGTDCKKACCADKA